jgi:hypothetical protein
MVVHSYNIHSLSINCDGESFLSADDLRINLWHADHTDEVYSTSHLLAITSISTFAVHVMSFMSCQYRVV